MDTELKANKGKFRVVGVDTFDGVDWNDGEFLTEKLAIEHANKRGGIMLKMHVYDDKGAHLHDAGTY